jgi:hypothetical protein
MTGKYNFHNSSLSPLINATFYTVLKHKVSAPWNKSMAFLKGGCLK